HASTKAAAKAGSRHRSHPPVKPAATACNRRIAPPTAQNQAHNRATAPHSRAIDPAPADPTTSRPPQCDAAPKAGRARARQAQTNAPATAPRAKDQIQPATQPPAPPQAPLRPPPNQTAEGPPPPPPNPPAALPQAPQGSPCAGFRGARQHPQPHLPAPPHPPPPEAKPPVGSCSARLLLPAAPKTTAG